MRKKKRKRRKIRQRRRWWCSSKKSKVVVQDDFDFDAELDAVQKRTTTDNLLEEAVGTEETEREILIRIGEMTPFDRLDGFDKARTDEAGRS